MSKEIKARIDELNQRVESMSDPCTFTLNPTIVGLMCEISKLQNKCKHHFVEGVCEYCYVEEN